MTSKLQKKDAAHPSQEQIDTALAAFRRHHRQSENLLESEAQLSSAVSDGPLGTGTRGGDAHRELLFESEQAAIAISIHENDSGFLSTMRGQVFLMSEDDAPDPISLQGIPLTARSSSGDTRHGLTDAYGRFRLSDLLQETYELVVEFEQERLVIKDLAV